MSTIPLKDGTELFYKDWGTGQPIVFHHGWPLSADDRDGQTTRFLGRGDRVIAHDRRGHGRSTQTATGNDTDTDAPDLRDAIHVGHSTGGGEVARYAAGAIRSRDRAQGPDRGAFWGADPAAIYRRLTKTVLNGRDVTLMVP